MRLSLQNIHLILSACLSLSDTKTQIKLFSCTIRVQSFTVTDSENECNKAVHSHIYFKIFITFLHTHQVFEMRIKPPESLSLCCVEWNVDGLVPAAPGVMMSWRKQTSSDAELGCFDHSHRELPSCVALVPNPDVLWCSLSVCLRQPLCLESQRFSAGTLNLLRWWSRHLTFVSVCHRRLCVIWTVTTWYGVELALEHYKWREKSVTELPPPGLRPLTSSTAIIIDP